MARKLQLQIPTPCHENWEKMTQTEKGRFCASCQKQVIDFSNKSDREIAMFFKKPIVSSSKGASVCGRFMDDQLNREIDIPKKRIPWLKYFFQFLIPAFFISYRATAQGKVKVVSNFTTQPSKKIIGEGCSSTMRDTVITAVQKNDIDTGLKAYQELNTSPDVIVGLVVSEIESFIINGKVVDHSGNPIAFATVAIKGTKIAVAADSAGRFTIIPKSYGKNLSLSVSCAGFTPAEKKIGRFDSISNLEIELQQTGTLGEVIVTSQQSFRKGLICTATSTSFYGYRTSNKISPGNFKIYPNPVRSNSTLNIEWNQKEHGDYLLQLFNQSGQLVFSKEISISEGLKLFALTMPSITPGNYFLKLTSKTTGKSYTEKLIVN
jgi:carboxypeptidase-like protein/type IX secretion system substrate protein